jgi:CheY-like chemotaxis protein
VSLLREAAAEGQAFGIVLIDSRSAETVGIEDCGDILRQPQFGEARLVLLTCFAGHEAGRIAVAAGFDCYLSRPLHESQLLDVITAPKSSRKASAAPNSTLTDAPSSRILVAEDNAVNQRLMSKLLAKMGHAVEIAGNGRLAVEAATSQNYDLILMDCLMPVLDGFEATTAIRRQESPGRRVPIIALTANAMKGDRERCLEAGMDDYLSKPIDAGRLHAAIRRWTAEPAVRS